MKLWGGRFTKETNQLVHNFNESLSFDQKFYRQDIEGSIAVTSGSQSASENTLPPFASLRAGSIKAVPNISVLG